MTGDESRFTSDRRVPRDSSWVDDGDWQAGQGLNVEFVGGEVVGRSTSDSSELSESASYQDVGTTTPGETITVFSNHESEFESGHITHGGVGQTMSKIEVQDSEGEWSEIVDPDTANTWNVGGVHFGVRIYNRANHTDYTYDYDFTVRR